MMAKSSGMGGMNSMPPSKPMAAQGMGDDDGDEGQDEDASKSSKMMALGNILDSLGEIVSDDLKPHIEQMQRDLRMKASDEDSSMGSPDDDDDGDMDGMPPPPAGKGAIDVSIGMGAKPGMGGKDSGDEDDEDEGLPKGGFLAILAKKMKKK